MKRLIPVLLVIAGVALPAAAATAEPDPTADDLVRTLAEAGDMVG